MNSDLVNLWFHVGNWNPQDVTMMTGRRPNCYWRVTWQYLCPLFLLFMSVVWVVNKTKTRDPKPFWASSIGWAISGSTLAVIPLYALYVMCRHPAGLSCAAYKDLTKANENWGPSKDGDRVGKYQRAIPGIEDGVPKLTSDDYSPFFE